MAVAGTRPAASAALAIIALAACEPQQALQPTHDVHANASAVAAGVEQSAEVQSWLAGLRAAVAPFHQFDAAAEAGWSAQITPCMEQPGIAGMGFHYGNPGLIDGAVDEYAPELLLYEPQKNGRMRLVAVEYIVPFTAWTGAEPPVLHGLSFHRNETFQVWALHAWIFEHNPAGTFTDWNPRISCRYAPATTAARS